MNRYLAIDLGAESGRAILAELSGGSLHLRELHRFSNTPVPLPGGLYWNTLSLFQEILEGLRAVTRAGTRVDGIAIDTWGVDFGLLGPEGALIDNPRHYRDPRTVGLVDAVLHKVPKAEVFERTGIQFMELNSLYQLYAIHRQSPWLLERASALVFMPDLLRYFLTGAIGCERTIASTSQFYDPVRQRFSTELLDKLGIPTGFLTAFVDAGQHAGVLLPCVCEATGQPPDTPVFATAGHDTASAVAAVPARPETNWCYISSGTWSLMGVELAEPLINAASLEANFTNEVGAGGTIRFLKNIPGLWLLQECRRAWEKQGRTYTYEQLTEMAASARPSEAVLDLDAFYAAGQNAERVCEHCRATGQPAPANDAEVCRVILHSLAVRYREVLQTLQDLTGRRIEVIHIVGGGSRNRLLNQFTADVTGRRVVAGPVEATAAGNALVQAMGDGKIGSLDGLRAVVRESFTLEEFHPKPREAAR